MMSHIILSKIHVNSTLYLLNKRKIVVILKKKIINIENKKKIFYIYFTNINTLHLYNLLSIKYSLIIEKTGYYLSNLMLYRINLISFFNQIITLYKINCMKYGNSYLNNETSILEKNLCFLVITRKKYKIKYKKIYFWITTYSANFKCTQY